ncbi:MAG: radical SAM protein [Methanomassiliicoccales archaeon]|nr:MAG: radical SAM protein [Methanomassiliicoccales archaeon]
MQKKPMMYVGELTEVARGPYHGAKKPKRMIQRGTYNCTIPLIRPSKLASRDNGGIGKNLSEGWCLNFAVGCTHGCPFCYVDSIHKRFGRSRYGKQVLQPWGNYFLVPENLDRAIERTPWQRWQGKEVMMSSTHDPYLPELAPKTRIILEHALPEGVRICLQTRSCLVSRDIEFLAEYADQVRLQISIATLNRELSRLIEPRVPSAERRLNMLLKAKENGLKVGVILAPIFPQTGYRPDVRKDLRAIAQRLAEIQPDHIFGESLHVRGENVRLVEKVLGESLGDSNGFDKTAGFIFRGELRRAGLKGTWWPETHR